MSHPTYSEHPHHNATERARDLWRDEIERLVAAEKRSEARAAKRTGRVLKAVN